MRTINIVVEFDPVLNIAASDRITYRDLPFGKQYSDEQLQWYNDMIDNVLYLVEEYSGFNVIEAYQSSESYSYYIEFEAFKEDGTSLGNFTIKFRIADHLEPSKNRLRNRNSNQGSTEEQIKQFGNRRKKIFRSIKINEVSQSGLREVVETIQQICDELLAGNVDVLDDLFR